MLGRSIGWAALALVGCSGGGKEGEEDGFPRACDQSAIDGDCVEYTGDGWTEADVIENCTNQGFMIEACPEDSAVGWCTIDGGTRFETVTGFYTPYWTAPMAVQACQGQGGTWEEPE